MLFLYKSVFRLPSATNVCFAFCHDFRPHLLMVYFLDVAMICSLFYSCNSIGTAIGNAVAGAIWNAILPARLAYVLGNAEAARSVFQDPFTYVDSYAPGSPERTAVSESYAYTQKVLCIVGVVFCFFQILSSLAIRNPELGKERSLVVSDS